MLNHQTCIMKSAFFLSTLFLITLNIFAQSEVKYTRITNAGSIRSTPHLCDNSTDLKGLIDVTDAEIAAQICPYAEESNWPSALTTLEKRNSGSRERMKDYKIYYVADIGTDAVLLWVPMEINQHMPEDMRDKTDFLIMIGRDAVELGDKVSLTGVSEDNAESDGASKIDVNASGFAAQLANVVSDYEFNFRHIKGELIKEEEGSLKMGDNFNSLIQLEGSESCYLAEEMLSTNLNFIATYGDFLNKDKAVGVYKDLVNKINETAFPCCTFVRLDEYNAETLISQGYLPFDLGGTMSEAFQNIVIEVNVIKGLKFSEDFKLIDQWSVVLRVRTND